MKRASLHAASVLLVFGGTGRQPTTLLRKNARNRTCEVCGADLANRRKHARYCSDAHRAEASRQRRAA